MPDGYTGSYIYTKKNIKLIFQGGKEMKNSCKHSIMIFTVILLLLSSMTFGVEEKNMGDLKLPLKGKKICLDPGHGGGATGAVGKKGLTEKEINLTEALMLKEMLEKAGAEVVLTRNDDSNVSISKRREFNKAEKTDLFVSMHHNANAQGDAEMNRIEVFYHWKDRNGPSEDAARLLTRELESLLKLPGSKTYMCWAYGVLRENCFPAILGEPSYLQNPEEEERLRDKEYLRSICKAYYKAILAFFEGGRPEIQADEEIRHDKSGIISVKVIQPEGTALIDPQAFFVRINRMPIDTLEYNQDSGILEISVPEDLKKGKHQIEIGARNIAGHISDIIRQEFTFDDKIKKSEKDKKEIFRNAAKGKKIVLDPEGGGDFPLAVAKNGLRASDANLTVSLYLYDYLKKIGADVTITRRIDKSMDNVSRVRFGLEQNPDIFLSIGHRMPEPGMREEPGKLISRIGSRWDGGKKIGKHLIFHLRQLLGTGKEFGDVKSRKPLKSEVHGWSSWEAMHAAQEYTAAYVVPEMFDGPGVAERLITTSGCRKEALAILYGLLDYYGLKDTEMASVQGIIKDKNGKPVKNALIILDDLLITQTESDGAYLLKYIEGGKHEIKVYIDDKKPINKKIKLGEKESLKLDIETE
jgi:N-acetylmuramoyl-L-alanine amidase